MRGNDLDDEVQNEIANKIGDWFEQFKKLKEVKILRCPRSSDPVQSKRIVTFVNASQQAYGAAVYIRCKYNKDAVTTRLIAAKSKVAPLTDGFPISKIFFKAQNDGLPELLSNNIYKERCNGYSLRGEECLSVPRSESRFMKAPFYGIKFASMRTELRI